MNAFTHMIFCNVADVSFGKEAFVFSLPCYLEGISFYFPVSIITTLCLLFMIASRRQYRSLFSIGIVSFLTLLSFLVFIPLSFDLTNSFKGKLTKNNNEKQVRLEADFFNKNNDGVYMLTKIEGLYTAYGLKEVNPENDNMIFEPFLYQSNNNSQDKNLFITDSVKMPQFLQVIIDATKSLLVYAKNLYNESYVSYLGFASLALGMFGLWGCACLSSWPLLSALFIFFGYTCVFSSYFVITQTSIIQPVLETLTELIGTVATKPFFAPVVVNVVIMLFMSVCGLIAYLLRRKKFAGEDL